MTIKLDEKGATHLRLLRRSKALDMVSMCREIGEDPATYFEGEDWSGLDLRGCDLEGVSFKGSVMDRVIVTAEQERIIRETEPRLFKPLVQKNPTSKVDELQWTELKPFPDYSFADLNQKDLSDSNFAGTLMNGTFLIEAILRNSDLSYARLRGALANGAEFTNAIFRHAGLQSADFTGANFRYADFHKARLKNTRLHSADLSEAKNLTQIQINSAKGNSKTRLPTELKRPRHWED